MKLTVILALPDDIANDQCCAADTVTRVHVDAETIEDGIDRAMAVAASQTVSHKPKDFAPVAVYEGHLMDVHQP